MKKVDSEVLSHLVPATEYADTYFCNIYFKNKDRFMYSVFDKVQKWVERHGGTCKRMSEKQTIGERKGFLVQIRFPVYNDAKEMMATIY